MTTTEEIGALVRERRPPRITEYRRLRLDSGLRLKDIAERIGRSEVTVWHYEQGTYRPPVEYLAVMDEIRKALDEIADEDANSPTGPWVGTALRGAVADMVRDAVREVLAEDTERS